MVCVVRFLRYLLGACLSATCLSASGAVIFSDEATFLAALGPSRIFDFETASGFPPGGGVIGLVDGVDFNAQPVVSGLVTSGARGMTGSAGTFSPAVVTFNQPTTGFGFFALDLTVDEIIRIDVDFETGADASFSVGLGGAPAFTAVYFGLIDATDNILSITLSGTDDVGNDRAWLIDDLGTNARAVVAEPHVLALFLAGLAAAGATARRRR